MTNTEYLEKVLQTDFPVDSYSESNLIKSYEKLKLQENKISNIGTDIIRQFHPSIWRCNKKGYKSPMEGWNDPQLMLKVINNRMTYLKSNELSAFNIRSGLSVGKFAPKISIFRPMTAKYLINKYLNNFQVIFDPCAGFSGRMLGTCALGKEYIGQDINSITILESEQIKKFYNLKAQLTVKNSIYDFGTYDCLFTCPPYGDKENWHQDIENLTCDEWIELCLNNYKCKTYLFVVDQTEKFNDYVVEDVQNQSHFSKNNEKVILIQKNTQF